MVTSGFRGIQTVNLPESTMTCFWGCAWSVGAEFAIARLPDGGPVILALLVANLLVFRTFRSRYFLLWMLGWLSLAISTMPAVVVPFAWGAGLELLSQAAFVFAVFLFSAAVLNYTQGKRLLLPSALLTILAIVTLVMRVAWSQSAVLHVSVQQIGALRIGGEFLVEVTAVAAAVQLIRRAGGRLFLGPGLPAGLLALGLVFLPLSSCIQTAYALPGFQTILEALLGISMIMIVLEDSQARTRRWSVMNTLANASAQARHPDAMLRVTLGELSRLTRAKAAWFQRLEGNCLVMVHHMEVSAEFLKGQKSVRPDATVARVLHHGAPAVVRATELDPILSDHMMREGFHSVAILPVKSKNAVIGAISLASNHGRYSPEELEFLGAAANQLGIALENIRFFEQIRRSQREWISALDSIEDLVLVHDSDFHIKKANRALLGRLGLQPTQIINHSCQSVLPHAQGDWTGCPYCSRGDDFAEAVDPCFGGFSLVSTSSYVWKNAYADQGTKTLGTIHVIRDTTQRRAAEEKYRLLFEQIQEGVFVSDANGKLLDCNQALINMLGYNERDELLALHADALYAAPDQRQGVLDHIKKQNYVRSFEVNLCKKDGTKVFALETSFATRNAAGEIETYQGFLQDITEKKQAEDELRRRNRELHTLNAIAVVATQSFDLDEILNLTLRQVINLFSAESGSVYLTDDGSGTLRRRAAWGHGSENVLRHGELHVPEEFWKSITDSKTEVITGSDLRRIPDSVIEILHPEGLRSGIWAILWSKDRPMGLLGVSCQAAFQFTPNDRKLMVAVGSQLATTIDKIRLYEETTRAYDDLRRTQEQLLQSEKMSAVGQLISGVAHELNNPLTAILGYAQLLENEALNDRSRDFVGKLFKQAQRTHRLVQNLLSFSRQRKPQKARVDIRRVLEDTLVLREYDLKRYNIAVERKFEADQTAVTGDPHQLEQVFLNIINNAVDAILEVAQTGVLHIRVYLQDGNVCADFQDSGPGFSDAKRIFDPFYTTKAVGKGTGLGLSICYGIVKEHGGEIEASNASEGGAIVRVRLPAAAAAAPAQVPSNQPRELALQGQVLVVDDEETVLEFQREVLAGAGAQVVVASSVEEAISKLQTSKFDAVIMNGAMPKGWDARRICEVFAQADPGLRRHLLLTFTNLLDPETLAFLREKNIAYLVKPFEIADLINATRRLLAKVDAASTS